MYLQETTTTWPAMHTGLDNASVITVYVEEILEVNPQSKGEFQLLRY